MNKVIIPTGYMGSGSSAVTDLFSEFDGFLAPHGSFEYVFLHCPNGVFDLEDKLLRGNNAIRSDEALRTFWSAMKELYDCPFWWPGNYKSMIGSAFLDLTQKYMQDLTQFTFRSYWYHQEQRGIKALPRLALNKVLRFVSGNTIKLQKPLRYRNMEIALPTETEFYTASRSYLNAILQLMGIDDRNLILDQLFLPFNSWRLDNYLPENGYCIIVDRDPRDVFIMNKYIWTKRDATPVPYPLDAAEFCDFYSRLRISEWPTSSNHVIRIHFEDLVYRYDETREKLMEFAGIERDLPSCPRTHFNPDASVNNTQIFTLPQFKEEVDLIERQLDAYLYQFPYTRDVSLNETF